VVKFGAGSSSHRETQSRRRWLKVETGPALLPIAAKLYFA
jgi:hypothetical protein